MAGGTFPQRVHDLAQTRRSTMPGDRMAFWSEYPPLEAFAAVDAVLGKVVKCRLTGQFKGHHILHIGYPPDFDLSAVEPQVRQELDAIGWQFVTTGTRLELRDTSEIPSFGAAPILLRAVSVGYHVEFPMKSGHGVNGYSVRSYSAGE